MLFIWHSVSILICFVFPCFFCAVFTKPIENKIRNFASLLSFFCFVSVFFLTHDFVAFGFILNKLNAKRKLNLQKCFAKKKIITALQSNIHAKHSVFWQKKQHTYIQKEDNKNKNKISKTKMFSYLFLSIFQRNFECENHLLKLETIIPIFLRRQAILRLYQT